MKKKFLSVLLTLMLCLSLLPTSVLASEVLPSSINISYDYFNKTTISIAGQTTSLSGEGWRYEPASKTLILDGFEGEDIYFYEGNEIVDNFTLELRGTNTLSGSLSFMSAWNGTASTATIAGSGSIVVDNMYANKLNVIMKGGTITTSGIEGRGGWKAGVIFYQDNSFQMIDGTLNAIGRDYGIYAERNGLQTGNIILEGGTVTAHGDYAAIWIQRPDPEPTPRSDVLNLGGRTAVGGKQESDQQVLSIKEIQKDVPRYYHPLYITALTSGELTSGTETEEGWREWLGAAKYAYISGGGQTVPSTTTPSTSSTGAVLSPQKLAVDGNDVECEKYNIGGSNYFKLRDLAYLLNGTGSQFGVGYDATTSTVTISTGVAYESAGGELATGVDNSATAQPSSQSILIDGVAHSGLTVYNIGGSNFFQLRELSNILGFEVGYDQDTNTAIVRSTQK